MSERLTRREFLRTGAIAAASTVGLMGCSTKQTPAQGAPEAPKPVDNTPYTPSDARSDAMLVPKKFEKVDDHFVFSTETLPEGKRVALDITAEQAYQISFAGPVVPQGKQAPVDAIILPKQDGTLKVLKMREGQEVQLRVFKDKDSKEPIVTTGGEAGANLKQGTAPNWMKGVHNAIESKDAYKGAKNDFVREAYDYPVTASFKERAIQGKFGDDFKNSAMYLDGAVEQALTSIKAKSGK